MRLATVSQILSTWLLARLYDHSSKRPIPGTLTSRGWHGTSSASVPYLVLHRKGFTLPPRLLVAR